MLILAIPALAGVRALAVSSAPKSVNLDADPEPERVVTRQLCENTNGAIHPLEQQCADNEFRVRRIEVEDTCGASTYVRPISSVQEFVYKLRIVEADGATRRPEIFFDLRSGATGRGGDIRLVHYGGDSGGYCQRPHDLFRYPTKRTLGRLPRGAAGHDSFSVFLANYSKHYHGKEVRVVETYVDRNDAFCCPSFERNSFFRFNRKLERFVRYRTHSFRIKKKG